VDKTHDVIIHLMHRPAKIDFSQARAIALRAQGLNGVTTFGSGKPGTLNAIEQLGYVQIDTISVVERAHHHTLWSRVPDYTPEWLHDLHAERRVFEYWSHAAAFMPMQDFRQSLPLMRSFRRKFHWSDDSPELRRAMRRVLARIRSEGALRARDFESKDVRLLDSWAFGKMERRALHELWMRGDLMVASRQGFQKSYDLAERVLPKNIDRSMPSEEDAADFLIERTLRAHGLARQAELGYLRDGGFAASIRKRLALAVKEGRIVSVQVGDLPKPAYALPETLEYAPDRVEAREARILSPFDNLVVQRERLRWLFDFDYQLESYVPVAKRRFGHFVLPVLWGERFAARLEAKALREESQLVLTGLWFEPGYQGDRRLRDALRTALEHFALFNCCDEVDDALLSRG
jgi:uncharacterized protein YcaQ